MAKLFRMEEELISTLMLATGIYKSRNLDLYLQTCEPRLKQLPLQEDLNHLSEAEYLDKVLVDLVGNPIHLYSLLDRLVVLLPVLRKELLEQNRTAMIDERIGSIIEEVEMPTDIDLQGAIQSIARIQFAYRLDPVDMAEGIIQEVQTEGRLSVRQMLMIAESRMTGLHPSRPQTGKEYALAIEWAEGALTITNKKEDEKPMKNYATKFLKYVRIQHNKNWISPMMLEGALPNEEFFVQRIMKSPKQVTGKELRIDGADFLAKELTKYLPRKEGFGINEFFALCRGEHFKHSYTPPKPMCRLTTKNDPYFYLSPIKQEIVSEDPVLHLYHDVLTDSEMLFMTSNISSRLEAASVQDTFRGKDGNRVTLSRTQSHGWLYDQDEDLMYKLSKKTGKLVQLETARPAEKLFADASKRFVEAEDWQMGLYGPGGHYLPHLDAFEPDTLPSNAWGLDGLWVGNRIATVMFYLSDLVGGLTAFPNMGVAVTPRKGSAVFWYNMDRYGNQNNLALHGACPTALGIKWVSNKWIREGAQIWKMPCGKISQT